MKKTKLFTSIAALALVLGLGACELPEETTSDESGVTTETDTNVETDTGSESTTSEETSEGGNEGGEGTTYKLGAADPSTGVYYYFSGSTRSTTDTNLFLATTTSWDDAAAVTITDLTDGGQSLSFVDGNGATKYIAWDGENGNTSIQLYDEAYTWYWVESINGYCTASDGNASARYLALYASGPDFRAYNPSDTYLAYGHVAAYTEEPETITPEPEPKTEPVVGTLSEGDYLLGIKIGEVDYYFDGTVYTDYYGNANSDISKAVAITVATYGEGYSLSFTDSDGATQYIYMSESSGHHNFSWGADKTFAWSYDTTYDTLVALDSEGDYYFIGCYGTYVEFAMNDYGYLTGDKSTSNAQYPATLYEIPEGWGEEGQGGDEGGDQGEGGTTYKLGALDSTEYCYRYFNGETTGTTFLNTTTEWDSAVEVYITAVDDEIENSCTLSFIDANGNTKYISNNSSTSVTLADDPCVWVWVDSLEVFAQGSSSGRALVLYTDGSLRGYAQAGQNLAYPHVHAYTEAQENPEAPEVTTTYEQVSSLGDGGQFYAGGYSSNTLYLTTGSISGYNFPTSKDLDSCVPFTVTGNATDGYTLTCSDGKYVYAYDTGSYYDFGTSDATTIPNSGTKVFYWNDAARTLYCNGSDVRTTARYTYVYFEFYSGNVCAYGTNSLNASTNNLASFYQLVTA